MTHRRVTTFVLGMALAADALGVAVSFDWSAPAK
jgi:hypothetical protein